MPEKANHKKSAHNRRVAARLKKSKSIESNPSKAMEDARVDANKKVATGADVKALHL